jgi:hypothetical protein
MIRTGEIKIGTSGKNDKGKKDQKKKPRLNIKEKRKLKYEKNISNVGTLQFLNRGTYNLLIPKYCILYQLSGLIL